MNCESVTMSLFINHLTIPRSLYFEKKKKKLRAKFDGYGSGSGRWRTEAL